MSTGVILEGRLGFVWRSVTASRVLYAYTPYLGLTRWFTTEAEAVAALKAASS